MTPDVGGGFSGVEFDGGSTGGQVNNISTEIGILDGTNEVFGVAGVNPDVNHGDAVTAGTVNYSGSFNLDIGERTDGGFQIDGDSGSITLTANAFSGTVVGSGVGTDGTLEINGTFTDTDMGGTATYGGVNANIAGVIGQDGITAAFAGNTDDAVLVGGIALNDDPI
ncbi:hypothetical protein [Roseobacter sp. CCS2]|uniref:hypothetical protein n=1 Tax=Roseobacter sp. CCS2 TaxID=391593 RepID=UPI0000F3F59F|nr:hypothetical protein [Roseobacter sp. CCS2]EBA10733.1 hypothetical protein RCCS2_11022 [Roseobacter sp. CCS2]